MLANGLREQWSPACRLVRALHWITGRRTDSRPDWVISPTFGDRIPLGSRHHHRLEGARWPGRNPNSRSWRSRWKWPPTSLGA